MSTSKIKNHIWKPSQHRKHSRRSFVLWPSSKSVSLINGSEPLLFSNFALETLTELLHTILANIHKEALEVIDLTDSGRFCLQSIDWDKSQLKRFSLKILEGCWCSESLCDHYDHTSPLTSRSSAFERLAGLSAHNSVILSKTAPLCACLCVESSRNMVMRKSWKSSPVYLF